MNGRIGIPVPEHGLQVQDLYRYVADARVPQPELFGVAMDYLGMLAARKMPALLPTEANLG